MEKLIRTSGTSYCFFFLKMNDLNSIMFITRKNPASIKSTSVGFFGTIAARSISGNPNTMAGKF